MQDVKITANLPQLDVEIVREKFPEAGNEVMTIRMRATPSFRQVADTMVPRLLGAPLMPTLAAPSLAAAPLAMWAMPFLFWSQVTRAAWAPILAVAEAMRSASDADADFRT